VDSGSDRSQAPAPGPAASGPRSWHRSSLQEQAQTILRGAAATPGEMLSLAEALASKEQRFGEARLLLSRARRERALAPKLRRKLRQRHALYTYKDPDLPVATRLDLALEILSEDEDLDTTRDQETLGLAGAILKQRWEVEGRREILERSLAFYLAGYEVGPLQDQGYTAINAAYVLDLLAELEEGDERRRNRGTGSSEARREKAREIREELVSALPALLETPEGAWLTEHWWFYATLAEAHFGLQRYDEALRWLEEGRSRVGEVAEWELRSTVTQLAGLARIRAGGASFEDFRRSDAFRVLAAFLGDNVAAALTAYVGKVGLALSGGGFRASLFHIGVLARLAELDVLRHVEVLSCVSGGSILGAHYYLELRKLLQEKEDREITREDYVELVRRIQTHFLEGVQENVRTRVVGGFLSNLRMIFRPGYSRTMRAGELFERFIYSRVEDGEGEDGRWWAPWRKSRRWLTDLYVVPKGTGTDFRPRQHNWRRHSKVPVLILNATTLNTGHNWQFTASWMGEPPGGIDPEVGGNPRLRRMYYWEAPERYRRVRLGHAVAASACVPGLFEPLPLSKLYPDLTVRLVDGGVYDNQGIGGLLEQDCEVLLVSDASGQMDLEEAPSSGLLGVSLRSNDILMSRVRAEQYTRLLGRRRSGLLRGLAFLHLRKGLHADPLDWVGCQDPHEASDEARPAAERGVLTRYGIHREMQRRIAAIRTDLDSFSDAEAFALMTSGYRMATQAFREDTSLRKLPLAEAEPADWEFLRLEESLGRAPGAGHLGNILEVARHRAGKAWRLSPALKAVAVMLALAAAMAAGWLALTFWERPLLTVGMLGTLGLTLAAAAIVGKWVVRVVRLKDTFTRIGIGVGLALLGPLMVRIHLWIFDRLYLRLGRLSRVLEERR
jgi:predicted acylesterase/phospholipase RssA